MLQQDVGKATTSTICQSLAGAYGSAHSGYIGLCLRGLSTPDVKEELVSQAL